MPIIVDRTTGKTAHMSALIGNYETLHVKVDISALSSKEIDTDGFLKPNVPLALTGVALSAATAVAQVETATVAGTITEPGNVSVTVTSQLLEGGSKTLAVAVADNDDASAVALAIRTALAADAEIASYYAVSGAAAAVVLTARTPGPNDATLNIATATGTATGLTAAPTSVNTTAGVAGIVSQVPCVTIEPIKVAAGNESEDIAAVTNDPFVACAVSGTLNRDIMEDVLDRALTAAEIAALNGPNSKLVLSLT